MDKNQKNITSDIAKGAAYGSVGVPLAAAYIASHGFGGAKWAEPALRAMNRAGLLQDMPFPKLPREPSREVRIGNPEQFRKYQVKRDAIIRKAKTIGIAKQLGRGAIAGAGVAAIASALKRKDQSKLSAREELDSIISFKYGSNH